jgi:hypothetical protein
MSWQTELTDGIKDYVRKFEVVDRHVTQCSGALRSVIIEESRSTNYKIGLK